jgi:hypothetical protein
MPAISGIAPATQDTQVSSASQLLNSVVSGSVAVIQAVKQPSALYQPAIAGGSAGASQGAALGEQNAMPDWSKYALGVAAGLLVVAGILAIRKR